MEAIKTITSSMSKFEAGSKQQFALPPMAWFALLEAKMAAVGVTELPAKKNALRFCLSDVADGIMKLGGAYTDATDWANVKAVFKAYFDSGIPADLRKERLARFQRGDTPVQDYFASWTALLMDVAGGTFADYKDTFFGGLGDACKSAIRDKAGALDSVSTMLAAAKSWEHDQLRGRAADSHVVMMAADDEDGQAATFAVPTFKGQQRSAAKQFVPKSPSSKRKAPPRPCKHCGGQHWDQDCPKKQHVGKPNSSVSGIFGLYSQRKRIVAKCLALVDGADAVCVIDSGAAINCLSVQLAIQAGTQIDKSDRARVQLADGRWSTSVGSASVTVQLPVLTRRIKCLVLENSPADILWSWTEARAAGIDLCGSDGSIRCGDKTMPLLEESAGGVLAVLEEPTASIKIGRGDESQQQMDRATRLLRQHAELFDHGDEAPAMDEPPVHLEVEEPGVPFAAPRLRLSHADDIELERQLRQLRDAGAVVQSKSRWAHQAFIHRDAKKSPRFIVNFKPTNARFQEDRTPAPNIEELLAELGPLEPNNRLWISRIDLRKAYHQLRVDPESQEYLSFTTRSGQWKYTRVPFGLATAGALLNRVLLRVFDGIAGFHGYSDDWILITNSFEQHEIALAEILRRCSNKRIRLHAEKCEFLVDTTKFLGRLIDCHGVRPDPADVEAITEVKPPRSRRQLQVLLGKVQWLAPFYPDLGATVGPLHELLHRDVVWSGETWTPRHQAVLDDLKSKAAHPATLATPDWSLPFELETDGCAGGFGAAIFQWQHGTRRPVALASRAARGNEKLLGASDIELTALKFATDRFYYYLHSRKFTWITDHISARGLAANTLSRKFLRWAGEIADFDFDIEYRAGASNVLADSLSRAHLDDPDDVTLVAAVPASTPTEPSVLELLQAQSADPECRQAMAQVKKGAKTEPKLTVNAAGLLCVPYLRFGAVVYKPVIPASLRRRVIDYAHHLSGHAGTRETARRVTSSFHWATATKMRTDVEQFCQGCLTCARIRGPARSRVLPSGTLSAAAYPNQVVFVDILQLPHAVTGHNYVLVMVDGFSRYVQAVELATKSAEEAARALERAWIRPFGPPAILHADQGPEWQGAFGNLMRQHQVQRSSTTAYHPQGNGICERTNQAILNKLRAATGTLASNWPERLTSALLAINSSIHSATDLPPSMLWLRRELRGTQPTPASTTAVSVQQQELFADRARADAQDAASAKQALTDAQNNRAEIVQFQLGDWVYVRQPIARDKIRPAAEKLNGDWLGPCQIVKLCRGKCDYVVQQYPQGLSGTFNVRNIKPYVGEVPQVVTPFPRLRPGAEGTARHSVAPAAPQAATPAAPVREPVLTPVAEAAGPLVTGAPQAVTPALNTLEAAAATSSTPAASAPAVITPAHLQPPQLSAPAATDRFPARSSLRAGLRTTERQDYLNMHNGDVS